MTGLSLPDSLLTIATPEEAIDAYLGAGLKPILLHAPVPDAPFGTCSCGQKHDVTASGSTSAGKHPIARDWQKHVYTRDELRDQMSRQKFTPNVGIVLGEQPGGAYLVAVDVDDEERFLALVAELGPLPETPRSDSGRGYRLIFEAPPEVDVATLVNVTGLGGVPGVDVKVRGGQIAVAPSMHASGKRYVWPKAGPVARLPVQWALGLVKAPTTPKFVQNYTPQSMQESVRGKKRAAAYLQAAVTRSAAALAACGEGMRNSTLYKTACLMFEYCVGLYLNEWEYVRQELGRAAAACGLPEREIERTLDSAEKHIRESGNSKVPEVLKQPSGSSFPQRSSANPQSSATPQSSDHPHEHQHSDGDASEQVPPPPDDPWQLHRDRRPAIKMTHELHHNVEESIGAMCADDTVYQREEQLVQVVRVTLEESEGSAHVETDDGRFHRQLVEGSPHIRPMSRAVIRSRLTRSAVFQKWSKSEDRYVNALPSDEIVSCVHDLGQWSRIRPLIGVIETPMFCPGGRIVQTPGYDKDTCYLYMPSDVFPTVKDEDCTQANAEFAYREMLSDVFVDFPYVTKAHRSVPIAAILTLIARPAIYGSVPAFLFDASTRGSGKTLQTDAIAMVTTGRGAPRMNYTSDEIELEKILGGYALKGSPFICLDNVPSNRAFGGGPLDRVLTAKDKVELRVLGRSEIPTLSWRAVIMATGNNMQLYGDTARRSIIARLEPVEDRPEDRAKFKHDPLLAYVSAQRSRLVSYALLILRAYHRAGYPDMGCPRWGSFEEWARLIPNAIVFAGGADPLGARPERDEDVDTETQSLKCLLDQIPKLAAKLHDLEPGAKCDVGVAARSMISALYEQSPEWPEFEPMREAIETMCRPRGGGRGPSKPDAITLGYKLRAMKDRPIDGMKLVGKPGEAHVVLWRVEKAYARDLDAAE